MTFGACRTSSGGAVIEDNVQGGNEDVTLTEGDIADEEITVFEFLVAGPVDGRVGTSGDGLSDDGVLAKSFISLLAPSRLCIRMDGGAVGERETVNIFLTFNLINLSFKGKVFFFIFPFFKEVRFHSKLDIGCGLAGGDWKICYKLIKEFAMKYNKTVTIIVPRV